MGRSTLKLLQRWMSLDQDLSHRCGVVLSEFAEIWMVDVKTIRRDLDAFKRLGHPAVCQVKKPGVLYVWRYRPGTRPLFARNLDDEAEA